MAMISKSEQSAVLLGEPELTKVKLWSSKSLTVCSRDGWIQQSWKALLPKKGYKRQMLVTLPYFFPWDTQIRDEIYLCHEIICELLFLCLGKNKAIYFFRAKYTKTCLNIATGIFNGDLKDISKENLGKPPLLPQKSTANCKYFCWQTLFCSTKFFPIRNLLPQRPAKKGL